jgi:hypothetical protein
MFLIDDDIAYNDYKDYLLSSPEIVSVEGNIITTKDFTVEVKAAYSDIIEMLQSKDVHKAVIENSGYKFKTY